MTSSSPIATGNGPSLERRQFMKAAGVTGAVGALGGAACRTLGLTPISSAQAAGTIYSSLTTGIGNLYLYSDGRHGGPLIAQWQLQLLGVLAQTPKQALLASWQDSNGGWNIGFPLPGQNTGSDIIQLVARIGNGGNLQIIGLNFDATPLLLAWQNQFDGSWHYPGSLRLGLGRRYSQLVTGPDYPNSPIQLVGLGASDHLVYLAAWQNTTGVWTALDAAIGAGRYSQLTVGSGNGGLPQVLGLGFDGLAYLATWQDSTGNWHPVGVQLPGQTTPLSEIHATRGANALQVVGLTRTGGRPYLAGWQDNSGGWHPGGSLGGGIQFSQLVACTLGLIKSDVARLIGLGAANGFAYDAGYLDVNGIWHPGIALPGQGVRFKQLVAGPSEIQGSLQVIGLDATYGLPYQAAWLDSNNVWHPGGWIASAT